jgi:hypothetical protein
MPLVYDTYRLGYGGINTKWDLREPRYYWCVKKYISDRESQHPFDPSPAGSYYVTQADDELVHGPIETAIVLSTEVNLRRIRPGLWGTDWWYGISTPRRPPSNLLDPLFLSPSQGGQIGFSKPWFFNRNFDEYRALCNATY